MDFSIQFKRLSRRRIRRLVAYYWIISAPILFLVTLLIRIPSHSDIPDMNNARVPYALLLAICFGWGLSILVEASGIFLWLLMQALVFVASVSLFIPFTSYLGGLYFAFAVAATLLVTLIIGAIVRPLGIQKPQVESGSPED